MSTAGEVTTTQRRELSRKSHAEAEKRKMRSIQAGIDAQALLLAARAASHPYLFAKGFGGLTAPVVRR